MFLAENIHKNRSSIVLIGEHLFMHKDAYQSRKNLRNGMPGLYADTERLVTATFSKSGLIVFLNCVMCTFGTVPNKTDIGMPYYYRDGVELYYNKHDGSWRIDRTRYARGY